VRTLHRILKPGGVLLLTTPGITQVPHGTELGAHVVLGVHGALDPANVGRDLWRGQRVQLSSHGNVLFRHGHAVWSGGAVLGSSDLEVHDPDYPVIIAARANGRRPAGG
jgi:hypothetical protein